MKRLVGAVCILTLLGGAAASAQPYRGDRDYGGGRGDNTAAMVGIGVGALALGALLASSSHRTEVRYGDRDDYGPPPPPPRWRHSYGWRHDRDYGPPPPRYWDRDWDR